MAAARERIDDSLVEEAHRHLAGCTTCQRFFLRDPALVARLRALPLREAPLHLRDRVRAALEAERQSRGRGPLREATPRGGPNGPRRSGVLLGAGLTLLLGFAGGWLLGSEGEGSEGGTAEADGPVAQHDREPQSTIEGFVEGAVPEARLLTSSTARVAAFLRDELRIGFTPPDHEGFQLVGVEICVWEDKRGAVVLYQRMGQVLYHFVLAGEDEDVLELRLSGAAPERWAGGAEPNVAVWGGPKVQEALVGNVNAGSILELAVEDPAPGIDLQS